MEQLSHEYGCHHSHVIHTSSHHLDQTLHDGQTEMVSTSQQLGNEVERQGKANKPTMYMHAFFYESINLGGVVEGFFLIILLASML